MLLCALSTLGADSVNYMCAHFDESVVAALRKIITPKAEQVILVEGQRSFDYSSVRGEPDYFLVPTTSVSGGRILAMSPLNTSDFSPWYGTVDTVATFTDVISKEVFTSVIVRNQDPVTGQITSRGTLVVDGMDFYILTTYYLSPRYPSTTLTWGIGATYGDVGINIDSMVCPQEQAPIPANKLVEIHQVENEAGAVGAFFTLQRPLHAGNQIEVSVDLLSWTRLNKADLLISGDGRKVFYQSAGKKQEYFRIVNGE